MNSTRVEASSSPAVAETSRDFSPAKTRGTEGLSLKANFIWISVATGSLHLAYFAPELSFLIIVYLVALLQLARNTTGRNSFYAGLAVGLLIAVGRLDFFWNIFGFGCAALWLVFAFWIGLFTAVARICYVRFGARWGALLIPLVWCGLEYFRSELYYLRFSWLSAGYAFALAPHFVPIRQFGIYGIGLLLMGIASCGMYLWPKSKLGSLGALGLGVTTIWFVGHFDKESSSKVPGTNLHVAGVQMEFPAQQEVIVRLDEVIHRYPEAELLVLSEYTFDGPIPKKVTDWCRSNARYLVAGGKDPAPGGNYYDTAFVISPAGEIVFKQGKKVPIQFFKDGLAAKDQMVWNSPWGKIGFCVCYDLSFTRVTDPLVDKGAQALIVPTMDVVDWGPRQHELHARIAPVRAREYGIPIFRVASSGISQLVDSNGRTLASAPCSGDGANLSGVMQLGPRGHLPLDRWLAPMAASLTGLLLIIAILWRPLAPRRSP